MKKLLIGAIFAASSYGFANVNKVSFPESVCSAAGGIWEHQLTVDENICSGKLNETMTITEYGHCNGHRTSEITCENNQVTKYNLVDCYCD